MYRDKFLDQHLNDSKVIENYDIYSSTFFIKFKDYKRLSFKTPMNLYIRQMDNIYQDFIVTKILRHLFYSYKLSLHQTLYQNIISKLENFYEWKINLF